MDSLRYHTPINTTVSAALEVMVRANLEAGGCINHGAINSLIPYAKLMEYTLDELLMEYAKLVDEVAFTGHPGISEHRARIERAKTVLGTTNKAERDAAMELMKRI